MVENTLILDVLEMLDQLLVTGTCGDDVIVLFLLARLLWVGEGLVDRMFPIVKKGHAIIACAYFPPPYERLLLFCVCLLSQRRRNVTNAAVNVTSCGV